MAVVIVDTTWVVAIDRGWDVSVGETVVTPDVSPEWIKNIIRVCEGYCWSSNQFKILLEEAIWAIMRVLLPDWRSPKHWWQCELNNYTIPAHNYLHVSKDIIECRNIIMYHKNANKTGEGWHAQRRSVLCWYCWFYNGIFPLSQSPLVIKSRQENPIISRLPTNHP